MPSLRLYFTSRFLIARTAGVGSGMWLTARVVDATVASSGFAFGSASPSVRKIAFGGSVGDWRHVRKLRLFASVNAKKYSSEVLSQRNSRSDFRLLRSRRSRNGRSPSDD